ncbi:MAG: mechanosensitive ion channel family protein [Betaproteobacteria bacterium]
MRESAPVKVANRTIIILHGPVLGYSAKERAAASMERIERAMRAENIPPISLEDMESGTRVLMGGNRMFTVLKIDANEDAGETPRLMAEETVKRLETAIHERREQRTPRYLARAAGLGAGATLVYGLMFWLLARGNRWIRGRLSPAVANSEKLQVGGVHLLDRSHVLNFAQGIVSLVAWIVALFLASAWLTFVLERFPYTRPWGEGLEDNVLDLIKQIALAISDAMPGLLLVLIIMLLARVLIRATATFFRRVEDRKVELTWIDPETARPTRRIFNVAIWVFALAMAYPYLPGAGTEAFKGLSVLVGVMVSIGGASVVGQAFSGLILMYLKSFRQGDYVRIGDSEGTVIELGTFTTRIRTGLGEEITLPNSNVMNTTTKNYSRAFPGTGCVVDTTITIGYSTPWRQVHAMLEEAARRTTEIATSPEPFIRKTALSDYYIEYRLIAYTPSASPERRVDVLNRLHANILDVFNEHNVQIMSPHYMMDPAHPQVVPKDQWHAAPASAPSIEGRNS